MSGQYIRALERSSLIQLQRHKYYLAALENPLVRVWFAWAAERYIAIGDEDPFGRDAARPAGD